MHWRKVLHLALEGAISSTGPGIIVTAGALFWEEFLYFPGGETLKEAPDFSESECPYLQRYLLMISPIR